MLGWCSCPPVEVESRADTCDVLELAGIARPYEEREGVEPG